MFSTAAKTASTDLLNQSSIKGRVPNPTPTNLLSAAPGKSKKLSRGLLRFKDRKGQLQSPKNVIPHRKERLP